MPYVNSHEARASLRERVPEAGGAPARVPKAPQLDSKRVQPEGLNRYVTTTADPPTRAEQTRRLQRARAPVPLRPNEPAVNQTNRGETAAESRVHGPRRLGRREKVDEDPGRPRVCNQQQPGTVKKQEESVRNSAEHASDQFQGHDRRRESTERGFFMRFYCLSIVVHI